MTFTRVPWLTLLLAVFHGASGLLVLIIASWFIAASAIAPVGFNYVVPAVVIRALALIRIGAGYAQMWAGHKDMLNRTRNWRLGLFSQLAGKRIEERQWVVEALSRHTENLASVWIGWATHQASAIVMLLAALVTATWLDLPGTYSLVLLGIAWLLIQLALVLRGLQIAAREIRHEQRFRFESEHFLDTSSLWHLRVRSHNGNVSLPGAPSATNYWQAQRDNRRAAESAEWLFQGVSIGLLVSVMLLAPLSVLHAPLAVIIPMLLLAAPDWLGRSFKAGPALTAYRQSQRAMSSLSFVPVGDAGQFRPRSGIEVRQFAAADRSVPPIDFVLPARGVALIEGESGSGKSTILQALAGHLRYTGERVVDGDTIGQGMVKGWIYVEQAPVILHSTLRENLCPGDLKAPECELIEGLEALGLSHLLPLDSWLGQGGRHLSGGESKRVALLRAALSSPDVLLVDEPFEGLDTQNIRRVSGFLSRLGITIPVVVASHMTAVNVQLVQTIKVTGIVAAPGQIAQRA